MLAVFVVIALVSADAIAKSTPCQLTRGSCCDVTVCAPFGILDLMA